MSEFKEFNPTYEYKHNSSDKLFAILATNSDISKLAFKIQATKRAQVNFLSLKKTCSATAV